MIQKRNLRVPFFMELREVIQLMENKMKPNGQLVLP